MTAIVNDTGIVCYVCNNELGTNPDCGKNITPAVRRPPCVWCHTDPTIQVLCVKKAAIKVAAKAKQDEQDAENKALYDSRIASNHDYDFIHDALSDDGSFEQPIVARSDANAARIRPKESNQPSATSQLTAKVLREALQLPPSNINPPVNEAATINHRRRTKLTKLTHTKTGQYFLTSKMLPASTKVFVPPEHSNSGMRGYSAIVKSANPTTRRYVLTTRDAEGLSQDVDVPQSWVLRYVSATGTRNYPHGAFAGPVSVANRAGKVDGCAVDHCNVAVYYLVLCHDAISDWYHVDDVSALSLPSLAHPAAPLQALPIQSQPIVLSSSSSSVEPPPSKGKEPKPQSLKRPHNPRNDSSTAVPTKKQDSSSSDPECPVSRGAQAAAIAAAAVGAIGAAPFMEVESPVSRKQMGTGMPPPVTPPFKAQEQPECDSSVSHSEEVCCRSEDEASSRSGSGSNERTAVTPHIQTNSGPKKRKRAVRAADAEGKTRGERFEYTHEDKTTDAIFFYLSSNIPWLHSRRSQRSIWLHHLKTLQQADLCLELKSHKDAVRSLSTWAAAVCKERQKFRLTEGRTSGVGKTKPTTAVDDVAFRWEQHRLGQDKKQEQQVDRAEMMREAMTDTAISLDLKAAKIEADRLKRFATTKHKEQKNSTKKIASSAVVSSSPITPANARAAFTDQFHSLEDQLRNDAEKSQAFLEKLLSGSTSSSTTIAAAQAPLDAPVALLHAMLTLNDESLAAYASVIHSALGITSVSDFADISMDDIAGCVGIPVLQRNRLIRLGKAHNLGKNCD